MHSGSVTTTAATRGVKAVAHSRGRFYRVVRVHRLVRFRRAGTPAAYWARLGRRWGLRFLPCLLLGRLGLAAAAVQAPRADKADKADAAAVAEILSPPRPATAAPSVATAAGEDGKHAQSSLLPIAGAVAAADLDKALAVAHALEREGRYACARAQYWAVARRSPARQGGRLAVRVCTLWRFQNALPQAAACFRSLREDPRLPTSARAAAMYREATVELALEHGRRAVALARRTLLDYARTLGAERSLRLLLRLAIQRLPARLAAGRLLSLAASVRARAEQPRSQQWQRRWQELLVNAGRLLTRPGALAAADAILRRVIRAPTTVWWDDALMAHARLLQARADVAGALRRYAQLVERSDSAASIGSTKSVWLDDALLARAKIFVTQRQLQLALAELQRLREQVPQSRRLHEAAFMAAKIHWRRGRRRPLREFVRAHPQSRFVETARQLLSAP